MQTKLLTVLFATAALACGARAQDNSVATPTVPAPAVQQGVPAQPQYAQQAPAPAAALPAPNQVIYAPRLPNPAELTNAAAAQGGSVEQISQTSNQVTVVYRNANGQINTVAYQLLPTSGMTTAVVQPAPTVIYQQPAPQTVYYYDSYPDYYYRPRYYYPPVSIGLGFGYYRGWGGGGGWHGGGHHGR